MSLSLTPISPTQEGTSVFSSLTLSVLILGLETGKMVDEKEWGVYSGLVPVMWVVISALTPPSSWVLS